MREAYFSAAYPQKYLPGPLAQKKYSKCFGNFRTAVYVIYFKCKIDTYEAKSYQARAYPYCMYNNTYISYYTQKIKLKTKCTYLL